MLSRLDQSEAGIPPLFNTNRRIDLHCHSFASTEADEAVLLALQCPESFSDPLEIYRQATKRGMDFVTITDHDSIDGVAALLNRPDVISGEELTCYFPEDECKMHVLLWGITPADHQALQAMSRNIYHVAEYVECGRIAHAVAHPVYRQNDRLERWHLERLILLFKGFECLNGAHSVLHREAFEPMLDALTPQSLEEMSRRQRILARWPEPWRKARTGGSDDHSLLNIGRTWTEFPGDCDSVEQVLECLRDGRCQPGGEAGSSVKLAHNFIGVGARYFGKQMLSRQKGSAANAIRRTISVLVGSGRKLRKREILGIAARQAACSVGRAARRLVPRRPARRGGTSLLADLLNVSTQSRISKTPPLMQALLEGRPALAEHDAMFGLISGLDRDVMRGIFDSVAGALGRGQISAIFDSLSTVAAHQALLLPYYFAMFHQNRERDHLARITGFGQELAAESLRVGLFTDSPVGNSDAAHFTRSIAAQSFERGRALVVHTCCEIPPSNIPGLKNFAPMASVPVALLPGLKLALPPLLEILEWADRQQFDVIHIDSIGPMGIAGWLTAKMLRTPVVFGYHVDLPELTRIATSDFRLTMAIEGLTRWFLSQADLVLTRSRAYESKLQNMGVERRRIAMVPPEVDTANFNPDKRDANFWSAAGVLESYRVLYRGPVSMEKNLPMLADAFRQLCRLRSGKNCKPDVALIVIGDGPYLEKMKTTLKGLPAYFNPQTACSADAASTYAASDLFVFPSRVETLGQAVIEAQACGVPVLVSADGAPPEMMDDRVSGMVLDGADPGAWAGAIDSLLRDEPRRQRLARTAPHRIVRFARPRAAEVFWEQQHQALVSRRARVAASVTRAPEQRNFDRGNSPMPPIDQDAAAFASAS